MLRSVPLLLATNKQFGSNRRFMFGLRVLFQPVAEQDGGAVAAEAAQAERLRCIPPAARAQCVGESRAVEDWFAAEAREVREALERGRAYDAAESAAESAAAEAAQRRFKKQRAASLSALFQKQPRLLFSRNNQDFSLVRRLSDAQWLAENFRMSPYEK